MIEIGGGPVGPVVAVVVIIVVVVEPPPPPPPPFGAPPPPAGPPPVDPVEPEVVVVAVAVKTVSVKSHPAVSGGTRSARGSVYCGQSSNGIGLKFMPPPTAPPAEQIIFAVIFAMLETLMPLVDVEFDKIAHWGALSCASMPA